ncbi:YaiI/YqxD family protein [Bacillus sp. 179-C3.3 HS]|uniref:YaiI/YqxD family protein n=1 Tax=Bacillus sp. 179-C3.3 HS TaxID=3232162 RepID=UPI0039A1C30E
MEGWRISHLNERKKGRTIYVDADACPVKDEILSVASEFQVPVTFVASYVHFQTSRSPLEDWRFVDTHKEAADLVIANAASAHDIVVTQDIGLASLLLPKDVIVLSERGRMYKNDTIDFDLERRHMSSRQRRKGVYGKGPKKLLEEDKQRFIVQLQKILSNYEGFLN